MKSGILATSLIVLILIPTSPICGASGIAIIELGHVAALFEDPEDVSFKLVSISASFGVPYKDVGAEVVYQRKTKNREQAMIRSLERSGYIVTKVATA